MIYRRASPGARTIVKVTSLKASSKRSVNVSLESAECGIK